MILGPNFIHELLNILYRIEGVIVIEAKLWGKPNPELLGTHLAKESTRALEGLLNLSDSLTTISLPQKGDNPIHLRVPKVWRYHH
jgi:hypothetical protein